MVIEHEIVRRVQSLVGLRHAEYRRRGDDTPRADPSKVGRVAAKLAQVYYRQCKIGEASTKEVVARCAGNLVYAMDGYGLSFEMVCEAAEERVARVVSGLSPDISLPHGLRRKALKSKLVEASVDSQLVRLAELYSVADTIKQTYTPEDIRTHSAALARWAEDAEEIRDGLNKVRGCRVPEILSVYQQTAGLIAWVIEAALPPKASRAAIVDDVDDDEDDVEDAGVLGVANVGTVEEEINHE